MQQLTDRERQWLKGCLEYQNGITRKFADKPRFRSIVVEAQRKVKQILERLSVEGWEDF